MHSFSIVVSLNAAFIHAMLNHFCGDIELFFIYVCIVMYFGVHFVDNLLNDGFFGGDSLVFTTWHDDEGEKN